MKNQTTWILLMVLTIGAFFLSKQFNFVYLILGLFTAKFLFVAFQFMELKKAHTFWKFIISFIVILVNFIILIALH